MIRTEDTILSTSYENSEDSKDEFTPQHTLGSKLDELWNIAGDNQSVLDLNSFKSQYSEAMRIRRRATLVKVYFLQKAYAAYANLTNTPMRIRVFIDGFKFFTEKCQQTTLRHIDTRRLIQKEPIMLPNLLSKMDSMGTSEDSVVIVGDFDPLMTEELISDLVHEKKGKALLFKSIITKKVKKKAAGRSKKSNFRTDFKKKHIIRLSTKKNLKLKSKITKTPRIGPKPYSLTTKQLVPNNLPTTSQATSISQNLIH
ncbi:unnamed protein product [Moneuplotes crassus]|uniref:Uncharacterized protein n=1 Tax=Euplotes crassus TaxID=5936 RepID=A0AAD1U3J1_EUPCR|nr:unnamed protein product [Moneuplotes crassus]